MTIYNKRVNQFPIASYHQFIAATNYNNWVKASDDDSRNLILSSSDELIGNKDYCEKIHEYINNINANKACYDYLKSIPDIDKLGNILIPKAEY